MKVRCQILVTQCSCGGIAPPTLLWVTENNTIISEGLCLGCSAKVTATVSFKFLNETVQKLRGESVPLKPPLKLQTLHDMKVSNNQFLGSCGIGKLCPSCGKYFGGYDWDGGDLCPDCKKGGI